MLVLGDQLPKWIADNLAIVPKIFQEVRKMSQALVNLAAQVERVETINQSAVTLLQGLHAALLEALAKQSTGEDPVAVQALADRLAADTDILAAAVASTPARDVETVEPPAEPVVTPAE